MDKPTTTDLETEILDNSNVHEMEALGASTMRLYVHMGARVCVADVIPSSTLQSSNTKTSFQYRLPDEDVTKNDQIIFLPLIKYI